MRRELEKAQKQRQRAEEALEKARAKERDAEAMQQKAKTAKATALANLNSAEALETPPGLPTVPGSKGEDGQVVGPAGFLASVWTLAMATGAPKGDYP
eukprot:2093363-Alexandrium_andersonii.AAC.1